MHDVCVCVHHTVCVNVCTAVPSKSTNDDSIKIIVGEYNAPIAGKMVPQQREGESGFAKGSRVASLLVYIVKKFISHCQVQSI